MAPIQKGATEYATSGGKSITPVHKCFGYWTGRPGATGLGSKATAKQAAADWDGSGKVVAITGASGGLGAEATRVLAARGATVVMFVRGVAAAESVISRIKESHPKADIRVIECDLNSLASVAAAAEAFLAMDLPLHVLMLNAGIMAPPFGLTKDGLEQQLGVNHVAHVLLTRCLLPTMINTSRVPGAAHGRVVVLSSVGHCLAPRHGMRARANINSNKGYNPWSAYGQSKLANLLFTRELARRLQAAGVDTVDVVSCHPGIIPATKLTRHMGIADMMQRPMQFLTKPLVKTIETGAATQVYLATAPTVVSGEYYQDCNIAPSSALGVDRALGLKLWSWTEDHVAPYVPRAVKDTAAPWWNARVSAAEPASPVRGM